jgi:hypothetical protein
VVKNKTKQQTKNTQQRGKVREAAKSNLEDGHRQAFNSSFEVLERSS